MKYGRMMACAAVTGSLVAACNLAVSTPLGVTAATQVVRPGGNVTGRVINPDGKITVALQNLVTHEITTCIYAEGQRTFACPTSTDAEGLYVVGVIDASHPKDGTKKVRVAVTAIENYAPHVSVQNNAKPGQAVAVALLMWGADRTVTVTVFDKSGAKVFTGQTRTQQDGSGTVTVAGLKSGTYTLQAADRLWTVGTPDSGAHPVLTVGN